MLDKKANNYRSTGRGLGLQGSLLALTLPLTQFSINPACATGGFLRSVFPRGQPRESLEIPQNLSPREQACLEASWAPIFTFHRGRALPRSPLVSKSLVMLG